MITFTSSTFSGLESSGVISASITISGGIVSSKDINISIMLTQGNASGYLSEGMSIIVYSSTSYICKAEKPSICLSVSLHFSCHSNYSVVPALINTSLTRSDIYVIWHHGFQL